MDNNHIFVWQSEVRDYELDLQGIVNNANYFHYFEHARHQHLLKLGIDIQELHRVGFDMVLIKTETTFHQSLTSGDTFIVNSHFSQVSRLRFKFSHEIYKLADNSLIARSENILTCVAISTKKPCIPSVFHESIKAL